MKKSKLKAMPFPDDLWKMPLNDLWKLHKTVIAILNSKHAAEKRELEERIEELNRKFLGIIDHRSQHRPSPKVSPKFQNPKQASQTWTGRGKRPHWVTEMLEAGKSLDDIRIPDKS
jgi:DNA-binding protein H-NS